ncbi:hypothetical protein LOK49_LG08G01039 [Camellia lanceoleosa]|uniref:Uncharacterized protein n=1 Tax=Camellia lanceoleosa TaxID=1840588 RepID=A0ACC0GQG7_9ERIC|nr:hypothetical protein LOK49_LG08G01039 [Camellia lanceoleosa]
MATDQLVSISNRHRSSRICHRSPHLSHIRVAIVGRSSATSPLAAIAFSRFDKESTNSALSFLRFIRVLY